MIQCCAVALTLAVCGVGEEGLTVSARLNAEKLKVGRTYEIELSYELSAGLAAAGISSPILQIQTPKSVKLTGKTLKSHGELAGNEYLHAPYERLLEESPATIEFKLRKRPKPGDVIGLSVIAYVSGSNGESSQFVRRRLVLPLEPGATATEGSANESAWGRGDFLQIGDKAEPFELPRADGSTLSLGEYLGKKNVLVTTYRAFW